MSYAAGLSTIKFKSYIIATFCGMLPLSIITILLGYSAGLHSKVIPIAIVVTGALVIIGIFFLFKKVSRK